MQFIVKTTNDLSSEEVDSINDLFFEVFARRRTASRFLSRYQNTVLGHSYHSVLIDEGRIVVHDAAIPFRYFNADTPFLAALGADTMVAGSYRGFTNIKRVIDAQKARLREDGFALRIGFPNEKMFPVTIKGFKSKAIGRLRIYVLPLRIGAIKERLRLLNPVSRLAGAGLVGLSVLSRGSQVFQPRYRRDREAFEATRYKWCDGDYKRMEEDDFSFVYRVKDHEGVRTAFLLDVHPLTRTHFETAVRRIHTLERHRIDAIMYVGNLPFRPLGLPQVPRKFEPKHFNFTCTVLREGFFDESLFDVRNWEVSLASFDLV